MSPVAGKIRKIRKKKKKKRRKLLKKFSGRLRQVRKKKKKLSDNGKLEKSPDKEKRYDK